MDWIVFKKEDEEKHGNISEVDNLEIRDIKIITTPYNISFHTNVVGIMELNI